MDTRVELLKRVHDAADAISSLVSEGNVPFDQYVDKTSLHALCDSLLLEPEQWQVEDLEKILIIRDGLYSLRNELRDKGDEGEHSIERLLSATDRLYADLERAMRALNAADIGKAQNEIIALQRTAQIESRIVPSHIADLREEAAELLTRTHVTYNRFEVNLIKIDSMSLNVEVLQNAKLVVQRMSASVVAIKLSLEQKIIYEGIFRFLSEGAEKIVEELRKLAERFQRSYTQSKDFISDLSVLVEKGSRFTRHVAEFLQGLFGDKPIEQKQLRLKSRASIGGDTMVCAVRLSDTRVLLGGKNGYVNAVDVVSRKIVDRHQVSETTINSLARGSGVIIAGSEVGLETINAETLVGLKRDTIYTENMVALAVPQWGVVTGTKDGLIRRWTISEGHIGQYGAGNSKVGKGIQRMLVHDDHVLVAAGEDLVFVDEALHIVRKMPMDFYVRDMCLLSHSTLVLCGYGKLAHVNLVRGAYTRFMPASEDKKYTSVAGIDENTFCAGTDEGTLVAVDLASNAEIGSAKLAFHIRGMIKTSTSIVAYGGSWEGKSKNTIDIIIWEEILHKPKEHLPTSY